MTLPESAERIYVAGDCSVCASAGAAVFLKSLDSGVIFFGCPSCGCAWAKPPTAHVVDTADPPELFASRGFSYAQLAEIKRAGLVPLIKDDGKLEEWDFSGTTGFSPPVA